MRHRRRRASINALLAVLRAFGVDVARPEDAGAALRERERAAWSRPLEPVIVAWNGVIDEVAVRIPASMLEAIRGVTIELERGGDVPAPADRSGSPRVLERRRIDGRDMVRAAIPAWLSELPPGYHRLRVRGARGAGDGLVVSAPSRAPRLEHRGWGVFVPLYALRTAEDGGVGDLGDLQALIDWTTSLGGDVVATLPLLGAFLGDRGPFEPSPYSPATRLFWNDLYVDVSRLPGTGIPGTAPAPTPRGARSLGQGGRRAFGTGSGGDLVDYRATMAARRAAFEAVLAGLGGRMLHEFERWIRRHPDARDYARFRAAGDRHDAAWMGWPARERDGRLPPDPVPERVHLFGQWQMSEQLRLASERAAIAGARLHFDLPLGVNLAGYDVWRHRDTFAIDANAGSPPDSFFPKGQDWGFPPLHPERVRADGYAYPIACIRTLLQYGRVLRIDHVMSLHRLFWVPKEIGPEGGVYVRGRPDELYAILSLEAHRHDAVIVGEDLGTVAPEVRAAMHRYGLHRTYMVEMEARAEARRPLPDPPAMAAAGVDTHDMPTFASFWRGLDVDQRRRRGWLDDAGAERERRNRALLRRALLAFLRRERLLAGPGERSDLDVLRACLAFLARSDAATVTVNLEDLWLETRPQNVPGSTGDEERNWRRRLAKTVEEFRADDEVVRTLAMIDRLRRADPR